MSKFCYWSVAYGNHAKMIEATIASARAVGITEDFHVWADKDVKGAISHPCGVFNKDHYIFKFKFLLDEVSKLDYDYFIFIDADNYFVRNIEGSTYDAMLRSNKWFVQLESNCTSPFVKRGDWWGCPIKWYPLLFRYLGVKSEKIYNTNAGFWIVRKEAIKEFYDKAMGFFNFARNEMHLINFTEEPALAFVGHFVDDPELNNFGATCDVWASDWTGHFKDKLPTKDHWDFEDYMTGERRRVTPAIIHAMRSKDALVRAAASAQ